MIRWTSYGESYMARDIFETLKFTLNLDFLFYLLVQIQTDHRSTIIVPTRGFQSRRWWAVPIQVSISSACIRYNSIPSRFWFWKSGRQKQFGSPLIQISVLFVCLFVCLFGSRSSSRFTCIAACSYAIAMTQPPAVHKAVWVENVVVMWQVLDPSPTPSHPAHSPLKWTKNWPSREVKVTIFLFY